MATKILVPELGESVLEATVSRWHKQEGDQVRVGEVLVELETDKVNLEVGAKSAGVLAKIDVPEGGDVKVGEVLGTIDEAEQSKAPEVANAPKETAKTESQPEPKQEEEKQPQSVRTDGREAERQSVPQLTPVAARLARDNKVDVSQLAGTGTQGRVTKTDVEQYLQGKEKPADKEEQVSAESEARDSAREIESPREVQSSTSPSGRPEERERMSRRRRTIAQRLLEAAQSTAMLTTFNEIDMSAVMDLRKRRNEEFQKRHGIKLGFMSFFAKAAISALKAFPRLNAEIQGDEILLKHYYDIGMAIGSEEGLVVPVIRNADQLSFADIERRIKDFVDKTQQGKLAIEDLRGGSFTITNGGVFGSLLSTPILNTPEVGILGLHKIEERPVALNGQVVIRPMMYVALSYDHRIVDGREAVQFLVHIKELIEEPGFMLVEG
jgi:2-oxoglutarate dehydrogenase E2 component (dihydrolipoamide succinyltransferase)